MHSLVRSSDRLEEEDKYNGQSSGIKCRGLIGPRKMATAMQPSVVYKEKTSEKGERRIAEAGERSTHGSRGERGETWCGLWGRLPYLVKQTAQRPNVRGKVIRLFADSLRRHVYQGKGGVSGALLSNAELEPALQYGVPTREWATFVFELK